MCIQGRQTTMRSLLVHVMVSAVVAAACDRGPTSPVHNITTIVSPGVSGTPEPGVADYAAGTTVSYAFQATSGYRNLRVELDGVAVGASGAIAVSGDRLLVATADRAIELEPADTMLVRLYDELLTASNPMVPYRDLLLEAERLADEIGPIEAVRRVERVAALTYDQVRDAAALWHANTMISDSLAGFASLPSGLQTAQEPATSRSPEVLVLYVNGVWTVPIDWAYTYKKVLPAVVREAALDTPHAVEGFYNGSALYQTAPHGEMLVCQYLTAEALSLNMYSFVEQLGDCVTARGVDLEESLVQMYLPAARNQDAVRLADRLAFELRQGRRVIIVAHSQGNLLAQQALTRMNPAELGCVGVVGIAPPTSDGWPVGRSNATQLIVQGRLVRDILLYVPWPHRAGEDPHGRTLPVENALSLEYDRIDRYFRPFLSPLLEIYWAVKLHGIDAYLGSSGSRERIVDAIKEQADLVRSRCASSLPPGAGIVWTGQAGNGLWGDPGNWDKARVPGPADTAYIALDGAVVTLNVNATVLAVEVTGTGAQLIHNANTLQIDSSATFGPSATYVLGASNALTSGTLSGAGNVLIQGTFQWTGGRQSGPGTTTLASGAQVTWNGLEKHLDGRTMVNDAAVEWSLGNFVLWNGGHFINNGQLAWVGTGPGTLFPAIDDGLGAIGTTTNNGILKNTTSATLQVYVTFNNAGSVAVERGTIHFIRGGTHTGAFTVAAGAALVFAWTTGYPVATHTISGNVSGAGTVQFGNIVTFETGSSCRVGGLIVGRETTTLNGTLEVAESIWVDAGAVLQLETPATAVTVPRLMLGGRLGGSGVIQGSDSLIVTDSFIWTGGTMAGPGVTWIRSTATGLWRSSPKTLDARTLINDAATTDWPLGTITLANGAALLNTGVIDHTATLTTDLVAGSGGGTFTNTGTFRKSGSGSMSVAVRFDNRNVLEILAGTVTLPGDYGPTPSSALAMGLGGTTVGTQYGRLAVQGLASLSGTLNVSVIGGFIPALNDQFTVLTFGTRSGDFASVNLPSLPAGLAWQPNYTPTSMVLSVMGAATTTRR